MFVDFDKVFHETPQPQAQIPPALVSYLSSKLPSGVKYVIDKEGNCVIDGDGKPFTLGGYVLKITGKHKEVLGENFTKEDVLRYFYNIQKPIPLELKNPGYVLLNGEEFPVEKLFLNPHNPILVKSGKFYMSPKAFPPPMQIDVGCDSYTRKITISRVPNESINIATFESEKNEPLGIKLFVNEDDNTLSFNMSLKLSFAKTIQDIVESASIFNAFLFGKGRLFGKPLEAKLSAEGVKPFDETSIVFWVKVLKIEEHLGIRFTPPQEDVDFKTICLVEKLYQNLINNTPIRDDVKPDSLDGKWEATDEENIQQSIGKAIYFEFDATNSIDLFGVHLELCGIEGIMNAILERFTKSRKKYTLHLADVSEDKPRKCVSIFFRSEEERAAYRDQDHQKRITEFDNAKRAREYLN